MKSNILIFYLRELILKIFHNEDLVEIFSSL